MMRKRKSRDGAERKALDGRGRGNHGIREGVWCWLGCLSSNGNSGLRDVLWVLGLADWAGYETKVSVLYWMHGQQGVVSS